MSADEPKGPDIVMWSPAKGWERRDLLRTMGVATTALPVIAAKDAVQEARKFGLSARDFGARFDGRSDDSAPLQRAIDAAARQQQSLVLPSGIARLGSTLDLKGRYIALLGDPAGHTVLRAAAPLDRIIDAEDSREAIDSPLYIYGLTLEGGGLAGTGLRLRYRHRTVFDTLTVAGCETGVDEVDSWLARRINCRTRATATGWRLRGSNHSSVWLGCTFTDASAVHLEIGVNGSANDGNDALLFQGCDIEYGEGDGVVIAAGATATFDTCYLGENIGGSVLKNAGSARLRGGALFIGHRPAGVAIELVGGTVSVAELAVRGQQFGSLERLLGIGPEQDQSSAGKAIFRDVNMQLMLGGDPIVAGDVLGTMPMRVFAPLLGRNWRATMNDATIAETSFADERQISCSSTRGPNPLLGLIAPLRDTAEAQRSGPIYLIIVYSSSQPVEVKLTSGPMSRAPWRLVGRLPAAKHKSTYIKVDVPADLPRYSAVELIMKAGIGDKLTLYHATLSDSSISEPGPLANLAKAR